MKATLYLENLRRAALLLWLAPKDWRRWVGWPGRDGGAAWLGRPRGSWDGQAEGRLACALTEQYHPHRSEQDQQIEQQAAVLNVV